MGTTRSERFAKGWRKNPSHTPMKKNVARPGKIKTRKKIINKNSQRPLCEAKEKTLPEQQQRVHCFCWNIWYYHSCTVRRLLQRLAMSPCYKIKRCVRIAGLSARNKQPLGQDMIYSMYQVHCQTKVHHIASNPDACTVQYRCSNGGYGYGYRESVGTSPVSLAPV